MKWSEFCGGGWESSVLVAYDKAVLVVSVRGKGNATNWCGDIFYVCKVANLDFIQQEIRD